MAMTDVERQQRRRDRLKAEKLSPLLVKGKSGEFDPRIRVALALKELANQKELSNSMIDKIATTAMEVFPNTTIIQKKYIRKLVLDYLNTEECNA